MSKVSKADRDYSIARLREQLKPGDNVYCILRSVARSGLSRQVSPIIFEQTTGPDGKTHTADYHLAYHVAQALGWQWRENTGHTAVVVDGSGQDAGEHMVHCLGRVLFGDGYALRCRWL